MGKSKNNIKLKGGLKMRFLKLIFKKKKKISHFPPYLLKEKKI